MTEVTDSGGSEAESDSARVDVIAADSSAPDSGTDAQALSPCPEGGGTVVFSSDFDNSAELAGWAPSTLGTASIMATATDVSTVARASVSAKNTGSSYAVITRGPLPLRFAVRFSFSMSSLEDGYIVQQALDTGAASNLALSLQSGGWTLGIASGPNVILAGRGAAGEWHTVTYRFEGSPDGGGVMSTNFDAVGPTVLDLGASAALYENLQLGAFWPGATTDAPQLVIDYDDVTVWDCSK